MQSKDYTNQIIESLLQLKFITPRCFLKRKLKLKDVAEIIGTNRTYLSHYLNEYKHTTFYDYINSLRLEYAKELMGDHKYTLKTIAEMAGFTSYSSFHRAFRAKFGISPSTERNVL